MSSSHPVVNVKSVSIEAQKSLLEETKIPLVERNLQTGWPLLQVSMLTPIYDPDTNKIAYEHILSGGKCHNFVIGAFFFAQLLIVAEKKLKGGQVEISNTSQEMSDDQFKVDNVKKLLGGYNVVCKKLRIKISESYGGFGKKVSFVLPEGDSDELAIKFDELFSSRPFFVKPDKTISLVDASMSMGSAFIPEERFTDALDPKVAIFKNGQVFIDLGAFLKQLKNSELAEYLEAVFHVEEFQKKYSPILLQEAVEKQAIERVKHLPSGEEQKMLGAARMQLAEIADIASDSTLSVARKTELYKIINALKKPNASLTVESLQAAFKNILAIALQYEKSSWFTRKTDAGTAIRAELRKAKYAELRSILGITLSGSVLRYRDLTGHITGLTGENATKKENFFREKRGVPEIKDPFKHDETSIREYRSKAMDKSRK